MKINTKRSRSN